MLYAASIDCLKVSIHPTICCLRSGHRQNPHHSHIFMSTWVNFETFSVRLNMNDYELINLISQWGNGSFITLSLCLILNLICISRSEHLRLILNLDSTPYVRSTERLTWYYSSKRHMSWVWLSWVRGTRMREMHELDEGERVWGFPGAPVINWRQHPSLVNF